MFSRSRDSALVAVVLCTAAAASPPAAHADPATGGAGMPAQAPPVPGAVAYGDPGTPAMLAPSTTLLGETLDVRGTLPSAARRRIVVQRLDPVRGWRPVARTRVRTTGRFLARWRTDRSGRFTLRVVLDGRRAHVRATSGAPAVEVAVYRRGLATFYGPGLFGRPTACGQTLTPDLVGVAHRTLPCGTPVEVLHDGRALVVPVVDRGPFAEPYDWDLTQAAADALGFTGSGPIGVMRVPPPAPPPAPAPAT
jgi:hypothetical protein